MKKTHIFVFLVVLSTELTPKVPSGLITCRGLCELLRDTNTNILLMDVRPKVDFMQSHISHTDCINVPEEILIPGYVEHLQELTYCSLFLFVSEDALESSRNMLITLHTL